MRNNKQSQGAKPKPSTPASDGIIPKGGKPTLQYAVAEGENKGHAMARVVVGPLTRHAFNIGQYASGALGEDNRSDLSEMRSVLGDRVTEMAAGDLNEVSRILASQALSLDTMFTELARRSSLNMGDYLDASERYMRLALKAQANSRTTLEALAKLHAPREQIVKHVHVNEGGRAVVTDTIHHHHTGGAGNAETVEQPHATRPAGIGPALPSPDPLGGGVPIPSSEREATLSDARRPQPRRSRRES